MFEKIIDSDQLLGHRWLSVRVNGRVPAPRHAHTATEMDGCMWLFGGYGLMVPPTHLGDLFKLDMATSTWYKVKSTNAPPAPRHSHTMVAYNGQLYLFGGIGKDSAVYNDLHIYNPTTNEWTDVPIAPNETNNGVVPSRRWGHTAVVVGEEMLVFGGMKDTSFYRNVVAYSFSTRKWHQVSSPNNAHPHGRQYHGCEVVGRRMYIFGGYDGNAHLKDMFAFDLDTLIWHNLGSTCTNFIIRRGFVTASFNGCIYVFGGRSKNLYNSIQQFNTDTMTWKEMMLSDAPSKRQFAAGILYQDSMWVFGGQQADGNENDVHKVHLDATVKQIIKMLSADYTDSAQGHNKKGGLIGLASVAIGLGQEAHAYIQAIIPPVLRCFIDHDSRVRFYACESLFNIAKVIRAKILLFFNEIFDALCKLSADPDPQVKNGAQLFDRLLKDIVTESPTFDIDKQFIVGWIVVLDSVPNIDLLVHLPKFLDGVFKMLRDQNREIRVEADLCLSEFLKELQTAEDVDYGNMVKIIISHCSSTDEFTRLRALAWINEFINVGREKLLPYSPHILSVQSRLSSLRWILMLHTKLPTEISPFLGDLFPILLKTLSDPSDEVVTLDLEVIAKISDNTLLFDRLIQSLVQVFSSDSVLLRTRGNFIIRQLCLFLNPELIFRRFALILKDELDPDFASVMIQTLNLILLTSDECVDIRKNLKTLASPESRNLFSALYMSWAHSPASLFSLCMLCQVYEHSCDLLSKFAEIETTVNFLMELDRLVQLLESPRFMSLRLQLLEPEKYPSLFKALYGLLMILPQSTAFETLKNRLTCISSLGVLGLLPKSANQDGNNIRNNPELKDIDFSGLLVHFKHVQDNHETYIRRSGHRDKKSNLSGSLDSSIATGSPKGSLPYGLQNYINKRI
eukprot:gene21128-25382_t